MPDCIYLRKSRVDAEAEQRGDGETLARHEQALLGHAANLGRTITHIYREIVSGETISARPQMQQLLRDVEAGVWDAVHVMEVERLARGDTLDQGIVSQAFLYSKTLIVTPKKTYDPSNEFDEEYFEFGLFMSRREYKTINRRQQAGRIASMREGKWVANKAPYGYERVKLTDQKGWTLKPIAPFCSVVRDMFRWATDGYTDEVGNCNRLGVSLITRRLNNMGIPAPQGQDWTAGTVREILKNEAYVGLIRWGHRPNKKNLVNGVIVLSTPRIAKGAYQSFQGLHPPLVTQVTFDKAQVLLSGFPSRPGPKAAALQNPLAGLVICANCGRTMVRRPYQSGRQETLLCPYTSCPTMSSDLRLVESALLSLMSDMLKGLEAPKAAAVATDTSSEQEALQRSLSAVEKELTGLMAQERRTYELVEQGIYTVNQFIMRSKELAARVEKLRKKQSLLYQESERRRTVRNTCEQVVPQLRHVLDSYPEAETPAEKNDLLLSILTKVHYSKSSGGRYHESNMQLTLFPRFKEE